MVASPLPKRINLTATPERFKLADSQKSQPCLSKGAGLLLHSGGAAPSSASASGAQNASEPSAWSIRALFLPVQPPQPTGQQAEFEEDELGPLTQLAAAGTQPLSRAFCPHCGCFLSDVGASEAGQQHHMATCQAVELPGARDDEDGAAAAAVPDDDAGSDGQSEEGEGPQGLELELEEAEEGQPGEDPFGNGSSGYGEEPEVVAVEDDGGTEAAAMEQAEERSIQQWLAGRGLQKYADCFVRAGAPGWHLSRAALAALCCAAHCMHC
jgi:hypothetical protein